jgi:multidrug efflux pump subunit AcrB
MLGGLDYSMRIWLDPGRVATHGLNAGDVVRAIREQNLQVAAGSLGQRPRHKAPISSTPSPARVDYAPGGVR